MSKIPKISRTIQDGRSHTTDEVPSLPCIPKNPLRLKRRSKSVTDLRRLGVIREEVGITNNSNKLKVNTRPDLMGLKSNLKTRNIKEEKSVSAKELVPKVGVKRAGENSESEIKNKVIKKASKKVPDWDYKTRFSILNEKHEALLHEYRSAQKSLKEATEIADQNKRLQEELLSSQEDLKCTRNELKMLNETLNSFKIFKQETLETLEKEKNDKVKLQSEVMRLSDNNQQIKKQYQNIQTDFDCLKKESMISKNELETCYQRIHELEKENEHLNQEIFNEEKTRRYLHNCIQDLKGNIRVFCRVRPAITEEEKLFQCYFNYPNEKSIEISKCRSSLVPGILPKTPEIQDFNFDRVFDQDTRQNEIFEELSQLIQSALDGYNVCVFAYGQTGSGKTYTMLGGRESETLGMIPRSVDLIFESKKQMEMKGWSYTIQASFLEIYNETLRDLLDIKNEKPLEIRFNEGRGTTVSNLTIKSVQSANELNCLMTKAGQNRATAVTNFNEHSSRSHAVMKIYIEARYGNDDSKLVGSVSLVDLAGSECAKASIGERLVETKNINKSLSCLGKVMMALHKKDNHIPFRDSKLTYLLQSSLGGNCKCLMVVNISPNEDSYNESLNALRFASKVKEVTTGSFKNKVTKSANVSTKS